MNNSRGFSSILVHTATVFISSFCIMALELVAGRLIARHLGSSLYTWTSVIGVVLTGITIGYYAGGRIADRFPARKTLSALFILSSISCVLVVILNNTVGDWIFLWKLSWPVRVFSHVSLVFLLPSVLLGAISPIVAKMALDKGLPKGRTVGDIYAWGAAGSIAGTIATGYYLIPAMGTVPIIWSVGGILILMAVLYHIRFWPSYLWAAIFVFVMVIGVAPVEWCRTTGAALLLREKPDQSVIYQDESQYCYIAVQQSSKEPNRRFFMQDKLRHSDIIMGDINDLQYFHTLIFAAITRGLTPENEPLRTLSIGGGGYVFPQYLEHNWPGSQIDVAEIDPKVTEAAMQAFGLRRDTTINTICMDARNYVDQLLKNQHSEDSIIKYDFIYEDAFNDYSVPYQLVTKEFNDKIYEIMTDDGVYMINMIDVYDSGLFLGAYINTLEKTFPFVYALSEKGAPRSIRVTFCIIASKQQLDLPALVKAYRNDLYIWYLSPSDIELVKQKAGDTIITDDYAPLENMLAPAVRQSAKEMLATKYLNEAETLKSQSKWNESIRMYEKALKLNPSMSIKAYNEIGLIHTAQNNTQEALKAFQNAIDYYNQVGAKERVVGSIYLNMGILLGRMGQNAEAKQFLAKAAEEFRLELKEKPKDSLLWSRLGDALASTGDFKGASDAFGKTVELEPNNITHYYRLAKTLEFQGKITDAINVVKKAIEVASINGQAQTGTGLRGYIESLEQKKSKQEP